MSEKVDTLERTEAAKAAKKPGFFGRLMGKLDAAMKAKAEEKAKEGCCCGDDDTGKGGKCC